jgi:hypothetical protein
MNQEQKDFELAIANVSILLGNILMLAIQVVIFPVTAVVAFFGPEPTTMPWE